MSNTGPDKLFDYTVGVFYQKKIDNAVFENTSPGTSERALAEGCTLPVLSGGLRATDSAQTMSQI